MIGSAISAARSCYSPSLYYYAAHEKDGIGLWFLFGIACIALCGFYIFGFYDIGDRFLDALLASMGGKFEQAGFAIPVAAHPGLALFLFTLGSAVTIMLMLLNVAIVYATAGVIIGLAMDASLGYLEILRITVYAQVASYVVIISLGLLLQRLGFDAGWVRYAFVPLMLGYMGFGIYSAK